jgi:hypothetical protein
MSENTIRHLIALFGTLVAVLAWWSGYASGVRGWWWSVLTMVFIYVAIYKLVNT